MRPILIIPAGIIIFVLLGVIGTSVNFHLNPDEYTAFKARTEAEDRADQARTEAEDRADQARKQQEQRQKAKEQEYQEKAKRIEESIKEQQEQEQIDRWEAVEKSAEAWIKKSDGFVYDERCDMWVYPELGCPP